MKHENIGQTGVTYFIGRPEVDRTGRFGKKRATWKTCVVDEGGNKKYDFYSINILGSASDVKLDGIKITQKEFDKLTFKKMKDGGITPQKNNMEQNYKPKTIEQVSEKFNIPVDDLVPALVKGIQVEKEHTDSQDEAERIALDHLYENPAYYYYLEEMESAMNYESKLQNISQDNGLDYSELHTEFLAGMVCESLAEPDYDEACGVVIMNLEQNPDHYKEMRKAEMEAEGDKLKGYYADGGVTGESCLIYDENGEKAIDRQSIKQLTNCVNDLPQTKTLHYDFDREDYYPYRKELHKDIIREFKEKVYCIKGDKKPIAILMGGSPASGKSTFVKKFAPYLLTDNILKIDADEIRSKLPEYKGFNATQTHLETKDIVNTLLSDRNIGIPCKFDLLYDGTMNNTKSYTPLINLLKSIGYEVYIIYIDRVPYDVVVNRALNRYKKRGRFVPLEVIDDFFSKGTAALEELKTRVDGYIIVDGSTSDYNVIDTGGKRIPKVRDYQKIGTPIQITSEEIIREFKKGGEIKPDNPTLKEAVVHKSGSAGGMLVGKRHSEGGIKALNKSTGQPLEMEGGEVVITRNAVSDDKKRMFEGKMMTNREILSKINESGGGVSFADGGDVPEKCSCKGHSYAYGGETMTDFDIVNRINEDYRSNVEIIPDPTDDKFMLDAKKEEGFVILQNKMIPTFDKWKQKGKRAEPAVLLKQYKDYLYDVFRVVYDKLPFKVQMELIVNTQRNLDRLLQK